jgi:hypothetical protein
VRLNRLLRLFTSPVASATSTFVNLSNLLSSSRLMALLDGSATSTLVIFMHHFQPDSLAHLLECCHHFLRPICGTSPPPVLRRITRLQSGTIQPVSYKNLSAKHLLHPRYRPTIGMLLLIQIGK